eukprot:2524509-Alexandrium_andersonii.AAC.1
MSASLVGSEMCIRDSVFCAFRERRVSKARLLCFLGSPALGAWAWASVVSVSYTHLTLPTICSV